MEDDLASQLHRQIMQVTGEKDKVKLDLEALRRTVDGHLLRLGTVLSSDNVSRECLSAAVQRLDAELRGRLEAEPLYDGHADGTYEVLRYSLSDAQKRCQELNGEMLRVADANEELHSTLRTLKGTNRRLIEEVQRQTEELSSLTQQRLMDMEQLARLEEAFEQERAAWMQEARRSTEEEELRCQEELRLAAERAERRLAGCRRSASASALLAGTLRETHGQLKSEAQELSRCLGAQFRRMERALLDGLQGAQRRAQDERRRLGDLEHGLQARLHAEREVREAEADAWRSRHRTLAAELDGLLERRDREVSDLQRRVESVSSAREAEAAGAAKERATLHERVEGLARDAAVLDAQAQTARRQQLQLEARLAQAKQERGRLQQETDGLRQHIQESDDALGEAVHGNEALREQMELQRLDAQAASERDMRLCREAFEERMGAQARVQLHGQQELARQVRGLEESLGLKAGELQAAREQLAEQLRVRDAQQRDALMWRAQHELAERMRADVERELERFRQECVQGELRRRQEQHDELAERLREAEARRAAVAEEARRLEQAVRARETSDAERARSVADQRRQLAAELQRGRAALAEAEASLAAARAEAAAASQQASERRDALRQELVHLTCEAEAERRELEQQLQRERLGREGLREALVQLREEHRASRAALEAPGERLSRLEGQLSELRRGAGAELAAARTRAERLAQRVEELEAELSRAQARLAQTEQEVQEGTACVKLAKANHRAAREALEQELSARTADLQHVRRSIAHKSEQLMSMTKAGEDVRTRMLRDIEEAKAAKARRSPAADQPVQGLRSEFAAALEDADKSGNSIDSNGVDNLFRENEHLRSFMGEHRLAARHLQDIGDQMQRSLASMEDRAADLRRGLQR